MTLRHAYIERLKSGLRMPSIFSFLTKQGNRYKEKSQSKTKPGAGEDLLLGFEIEL